MAKSLGPRGIHVTYAIIDGVIDMPVTRSVLRDRPDDFLLKPDAIATPSDTSRTGIALRGRSSSICARLARSGRVHAVDVVAS